MVGEARQLSRALRCWMACHPLDRLAPMAQLPCQLRSSACSLPRQLAQPKVVRSCARCGCATLHALTGGFLWRVLQNQGTQSQSQPSQSSANAFPRRAAHARSGTNRVERHPAAKFQSGLILLFSGCPAAFWGWMTRPGSPQCFNLDHADLRRGSRGHRRNP